MGNVLTLSHMRAKRPQIGQIGTLTIVFTIMRTTMGIA